VNSRLQGLLEPRRERLRDAVLMAALFGAYVGSAKVGIELSVAHGVITPVWAPTGISLAALFLYGPRLWPAVALGALVANATSGASGLDSVFIAAGNTLEALVGSVLLRRVGFRPALDRVRDIFLLVLLGAVASTAVSATNGVTTLWLSGEIDGSHYASEWLLWWVGDGMGDLIVAALLFVLSTRPHRPLDRPARLEGIVLLGLLVGVSSVVFLGGQWRYPHLLFPLLIWAVLRYHQLGAVTSSFVLAATAIVGAVQGTIPLGDRSGTEIVQILEALTAGVAISLLILGAVLAERTKAVSELARAHAGLEEAQELARIGSWEWDIPENRVTWSDELYRLWGLEPASEEITYERYLASIHPEDRELARSTIEHAQSAGTPFAFDHRVLLPDRRERWIHGSGRVIADEAGAPVRMLGTAQDITERKQIDDLRDSILSAVSHELRTPLTSIIGFAVTLKERGDSVAETTRRQMIDHLVRQAKKLDYLLSDLLDLDRLRRGFVRPTFRPTDIGRLVTQVASGHVSDTHEIDVRVISAVAEVDAPKVERIVDNLLANAVRHTPPGTGVSIRVETGDGGVLIAVDDSGPGVAQEDREQIFEIFNRGGEGDDRVPGTGIGLSLVAQFTALHGGRAWVEPSPSGGASFRVLLPQQRPPPHQDLSARRP
jgi:PAS domain S-box-containing protein